MAIHISIWGMDETVKNLSRLRRTESSSILLHSFIVHCGFRYDSVCFLSQRSLKVLEQVFH
jgi:L-ribulose-5-phosphate 3-epimerase UlaE